MKYTFKKAGVAVGLCLQLGAGGALFLMAIATDAFDVTPGTLLWAIGLAAALGLGHWLFRVSGGAAASRAG